MVKKLLHAERGSTSILIVIMMVVLMVLGLAIMTTALSNRRLSDKKIDWKTDYYALESKANQTISQIMAEIDLINQRQQSRTDGFAKIEALLNKTASSYQMPDFESAERPRLNMTITSQTGTKNLAIQLLIVGDDQADALKLEILEYRQWQ